MTLRELADLLGLSQTTVSRALNGYPEVSESTRKRVVARAKALNYRPNPNATRLATGRSQAVGHVIPITSKNEMVNPIFSDFLAGAGETYAREGYQLVLNVVRESHMEDAYRSLVEQGTVDGVVVQGPRMEEPRIALLQQIGLPFLVHGRATGEDTEYSWLDVDNHCAFERATALLLSAGQRRIGLINGQEHLDFAFRRRCGYNSAHRSHSVEVDTALCYSDEMTEYFGYESARRMLQSDQPPTAFLVSSMLPAIGARRAVGEFGLQFGKDIWMIIFDDNLSYLKNSGSPPTFTAMKSSVRDAGRRCAEILLQLIRSGSSKPIQERWQAQLVMGTSTGDLVSAKEPDHDHANLTR